MAFKELINPRGYLSATQVEMWLTDPAKYKERYFEGKEDDSQNAFRDFGKKVADAIETGEKTGDEITDMVIASIPRYEKTEYEICVPLKTKYGYVKLLGKMDTFEEKPVLHFRDYKTGSKPWTGMRAQKSRQMLHYDTIIHLRYGMMAKERHIDWFETEKTTSTDLEGNIVDTYIRFTGKVQHFQVNRRFADILQYMALVSRVAKEIDTDYRKYLDQIK